MKPNKGWAFCFLMSSNQNQLIAPSLGCWYMNMRPYNCVCCFFFVADKQGLVFEAVALKARKDVVLDVKWKEDACNTPVIPFGLVWTWCLRGSGVSTTTLTKPPKCDPWSGMMSWHSVSLGNLAPSKTSYIYATTHLKGILFLLCLAGDCIWVYEGTFLLNPSLWLRSRASPCCPQCSHGSLCC